MLGSFDTNGSSPPPKKKKNGGGRTIQIIFYLHSIQMQGQLRKDSGKNQVQWTEKIQIIMVQFLAAGEACKPILWPTPDLKDRTFYSCRFSVETSISVSAITHSWKSGQKIKKEAMLNALERLKSQYGKIPATTRSMQGYIISYSNLKRLNVW